MGKNDKNVPKAAAPQGGGRLTQLVWANLLFWAFMVALAAVVYFRAAAPSDDDYIKLVLKDTFTFLVELFGCGFTLVTLFDLGYDYFAAKAEGSEAPKA